MFLDASLLALVAGGNDGPDMSQLSYGGCEADPSKCMASDFYSSDQAGTTPFSDPSARVYTYQGVSVGDTTQSLGSSYAGCEADPSKCMASDFYSSDQAGTTPFSDPSARVYTYQGVAVGDTTQSLHSSAPTSALYPECDPMPGWKVTWNPPDCSNPPQYGGDGWGPNGRPPVAWVHSEHTGGPSQALALPPLMPSEGPQAMPDMSKKQPACKPNPGHLLLCGHAVFLGAVSATADVLTGKTTIEDWEECFKKESAAAADSVTPVGGLVLRQHIFQTDLNNSTEV